ncbi:MAG: polysaccharide deacetylase family protein [Aggregatilineales bacterium]
MIKGIVSRLVSSGVGQGLLGALERVDDRRPNRVRVLTYHRAGSPESFEAQMRYLAEHTCPVSMQELVDALEGRRELPPRAVMVTFDDAYTDFAQVAWPALKRYGIPVTLFVPTGYPGGALPAFWWDRLSYALAHTTRRTPLDTPFGPLPLATPGERGQAFKRLTSYVKSLPHDEGMAFVEQIAGALHDGTPPCDVLGWDELRQLAAEGVTLGAHTRTHPLLTRVPLDVARREVVGSLEDLRREIGEVMPVFAYPAGAYNAEVVAILKEAGFRLAFTTIKGTNDLARLDPLRLRRINVKEDATVGTLRARLLLYTARLNGLRALPQAA